MTVSATALFPPEFRTTVTVQRPAKKDSAGRIIEPATSFDLADAVIDKGNTRDRPDLSSVAAHLLTIYLPVGSDLRSTDKIVIPTSHWMSGTYSVDGRPFSGPLGVVATIKAG